MGGENKHRNKTTTIHLIERLSVILSPSILWLVICLLFSTLPHFLFPSTSLLLSYIAATANQSMASNMLSIANPSLRVFFYHPSLFFNFYMYSTNCLAMILYYGYDHMIISKILGMCKMSESPSRPNLTGSILVYITFAIKRI